MRRKAGSLVSLEVAILEAALSLRGMGLHESHGFLLARTMSDQAAANDAPGAPDAPDARRLTAYGTLYKALDRLERAGYLESRWEDPREAAEASRPRRRLYRVTAAGEAALAAARAAADIAPARARPSEAPVR